MTSFTFRPVAVHPPSDVCRHHPVVDVRHQSNASGLRRRPANVLDHRHVTAGDHRPSIDVCRHHPVVVDLDRHPSRRRDDVRQIAFGRRFLAEIALVARRVDGHVAHEALPVGVASVADPVVRHATGSYRDHAHRLRHEAVLAVAAVARHADRNAATDARRAVTAT